MKKDGLYFLYRTWPGRCLLKILTWPGLSAVCGLFMDSPLSVPVIPFFIWMNHIDMTDYRPKRYRSFNEFFTRELGEGKRPVAQEPCVLPSPSDGLLSVYRIREGLVVPAKQSEYSLASLLRDARLAEEYRDGLCLVFRLCVHHYHRYIYPDNGHIVAHRRIRGILHTVRPVALMSRPVFTENSREYEVVDTENFGRMVQMEIGAMLVGRIDNVRREGDCLRGEEKGKFLYGGSTIILLLREADLDTLEPKFKEGARRRTEVPVRMGEAVLRRKTAGTCP